MFGFADGWVAAAYFGAIGVTVLSLIWGAVMWNKTDDSTESEDELTHWVEEESRVEEELS